MKTIFIVQQLCSAVATSSNMNMFFRKFWRMFNQTTVIQHIQTNHIIFSFLIWSCSVLYTVQKLFCLTRMWVLSCEIWTTRSGWRNAIHIFHCYPWECDEHFSFLDCLDRCQGFFLLIDHLKRWHMMVQN